MEIIKLEKSVNVLWDKMCLESDNAWFWHTTDWLNYCMSHGAEKHNTINVSFMLADDSGPLAICPLLLEKRIGLDGKERLEFSTAGSGGYGIIPAVCNVSSEERADKIMKKIFETIDKLAAQYQVARASFRSNPLAKKRSDSNILMRYGYIDNSLNTQIIDLTLPVAELWSNVRKGHKYDVNRGKKNFEVHIYDKGNADKNIFDQYCLLHHKAAGRITRPIETFEMMYQWILSGEGMLCGISKDGVFVGFSYIILYKDGAFFGSASDDPDFKADIPISHIAQWAIICWLKERGYKNYEIGFQHFGPQIFDVPTSKDLNISFFKRGFGGKTMMLFRGEKYYSKDYFLLMYKNRIEKLCEQHIGNYANW